MSETAQLTVTGMKCGGCENNLTNKLTAMDGVLSAKASHQSQQVDLVYDPTKIDLDAIQDAIEDAGFNVEEQ